MNKFSVFVKESYKELMEKVTWPKWDQLQQIDHDRTGNNAFHHGCCGPDGFHCQRVNEIYLLFISIIMQETTPVEKVEKESKWYVLRVVGKERKGKGIPG